MKKLIYLLISVMMLLLYTCSKEEGFIPDPAGDAELKCAYGAVITVYPVNTGDDTQALIDAFAWAKSKGRGSTVLLAPGEFTIGFVEVRDFNGYFKGSGKSTTKILNKQELPCDEAYEANVLPALMKFIGGRVTVSDLTIQIRDDRPCRWSEINELYMGDLFSVMIFADYTDNYVPANRTIQAMVKNVDLIGGKDDGYGLFGTEHNTGIGIWCGPDFLWSLWNEPFGDGEFTLTGCNFTYFIDGVEGFGLGHDAVMRVSRNAFRDCVMQLYFTANSGARVIIADNFFEDGVWTDISIEDVWTDLVFPAVIPGYRTEFQVSGNVFDSPEGVISLYLHDAMRVQTLNDDFSMLFKVTKNVFKTRDFGTAISSENNMDATIWNNTFKGTGTYGILVNGNEDAGVYANRINILNNNFRMASYTDATVYLGPYTSNCKVVGVATDKVIDEGNNNLIIGAKAHKNGPHYQGLSRQLPFMHERMMKMRKP